MKKQTAVQWLTEKIFNLYGVGYGDIEIWNQAQDMEREQIKEAFRQGELFSSDYYDGKNINSQYYEITYKGGKQ